MDHLPAIVRRVRRLRFYDAREIEREPRSKRDQFHPFNLSIEVRSNVVSALSLC